MKRLDLRGIPGVVRCLGSVAAEVAYTARGSLCATIGQGEGIVDVAAALCVCLDAGCEFRYLSGPPVDVAAFVASHGTPYRPEEECLLYGPPRLLTVLQRQLRRL